MNIEELIDELGDLDIEDLRTLRKAVDARMSELGKIAHRRCVTERWAKLERCKPGTTLYVGGLHTTRIGSRVQTGDSFRVLDIDTDRERIRLRLHRVAGKLQRSSDVFELTPFECNRLQLSRKKPERSADKLDRAMAKNLAGVLK
jgi:hypothetical protein